MALHSPFSPSSDQPLVYLSDRRPEISDIHQWMSIPLFFDPDDNSSVKNCETVLMAHIPTLKQLIAVYEVQLSVARNMLLAVFSGQPELMAPLINAYSANCETNAGNKTDSTSLQFPLPAGLEDAFIVLKKCFLSGTGKGPSSEKEDKLEEGVPNSDPLIGKDIKSPSPDLKCREQFEVVDEENNYYCEAKVEDSMNGPDAAATYNAQDETTESQKLLKSIEFVAKGGGKGAAYCAVNGVVIEEAAPFTCSFCGNGFKSSRLLYFHKRQVHDVVKETCTICEKPVKNHAALIKHKRSHLGPMDLLFECSTCGKRCEQRRYLVAHCKNKGHEPPPFGDDSKEELPSDDLGPFKQIKLWNHDFEEF